MIWICQECQKSWIETDVDERYYRGIYAGRFCSSCWNTAPYRKEELEELDPIYAGKNDEEE